MCAVKLNTARELTIYLKMQGWSGPLEFKKITLKDAKKFNYPMLPEMTAGKKFFRNTARGDVFTENGKIYWSNKGILFINSDGSIRYHKAN